MPRETIDRYAGTVPPAVIAAWRDHGVGFVGDGYFRMVDPARAAAMLGRTWLYPGAAILFTTAMADLIAYGAGQFVVVKYRLGEVQPTSVPFERLVTLMRDDPADQEGIWQWSPYPAAAAPPDTDHESGHLGASQNGRGYEFINYTQQHRLSNRGPGELSFKNQEEFFRMLTKNDPTAVEHVTITATYPPGASPTATTYTPRGGSTYTGSINAKPDSYTIEWMQNGKPRDLPPIPNNEEGWLRATAELKAMKGE